MKVIGVRVIRREVQGKKGGERVIRETKIQILTTHVSPLLHLFQSDQT